MQLTQDNSGGSANVDPAMVERTILEQDLVLHPCRHATAATSPAAAVRADELVSLAQRLV